MNNIQTVFSITPDELAGTNAMPPDPGIAGGS